MVFDLNGVHRIVIQFCHCSPDPVSHDIQLLRSRWFPATVYRPSTSFSFQLLDFFHKLQDQNKCNSYDFYHTIMQRTDNAELDPEIVSVVHYPFEDDTYTCAVPLQRTLFCLSFLDSPQNFEERWSWSPIRWHRLCAGRESFSFVPGVPPARQEYNYRSEPSSVWLKLSFVCKLLMSLFKYYVFSRYLDTLFLGIDGCFKTKLKDRGISDPDLGTGLAYMVNDLDYKDHLKDTSENGSGEPVSPLVSPCLMTVHADVRQATGCGSDLHAVNQAYTRNSKGYAVTGVVAVSCRHALIRPTGVVDLQKGEK